MFANLIQLITHRTPAADDYDHAFVKAVTVRHTTRRDPHTGRVVLLCWILIALKCWLMAWLGVKYHVPINPLWVIVPTILFALAATAAYFRNE